jgi:hypothetical protein
VIQYTYNDRRQLELDRVTTLGGTGNPEIQGHSTSYWHVGRRGA